MNIFKSETLAILFWFEMQEVTRFALRRVFLVSKHLCVMLEQAWVVGPSVRRVAAHWRSCVGTAGFRSVWVCLWKVGVWQNMIGVSPLLVRRKLEWKLLESAGSIMSFCGRSFSGPIKNWSSGGHIWRQHLQEQEIGIEWWIH